MSHMPIYRVLKLGSVYEEGTSFNRRPLAPSVDVVDMVWFTADGEAVEDRTQAAYLLTRADSGGVIKYKARAYQHQEDAESYQTLFEIVVPGYYFNGDIARWDRFTFLNRVIAVEIP
jgi:hypothetical protein